MIVIGVLGLAALLLAFALRMQSTSHIASGHRLYLAIAMVPLLLTVVVPVPFAFAVRAPEGWLGATILGFTRVGIVLSFILLAIGALLMLRAALAGDRRAVVLLGLETVLAAVPAGVFAASWALWTLFR